MERLLWLRVGRRIAGVRLWCGLVVRIMYHMAVWWPLEWRWSRLTGVHGALADLGASEEQLGGAGSV